MDCLSAKKGAFVEDALFFFQHGSLIQKCSNVDTFWRVFKSHPTSAIRNRDTIHFVDAGHPSDHPAFISPHTNHIRNLPSSPLSRPVCLQSRIQVLLILYIYSSCNQVAFRPVNGEVHHSQPATRDH